MKTELLSLFGRSKDRKPSTTAQERRRQQLRRYRLTVEPLEERLALSATWVQQATLIASDASPGDRLGRSVSIYEDTVVAGAPNLDLGTHPAGAAYVFQRTGTTWAQQAKLIANDASANDRFGHASAIYGDTLVVGAPGKAVSLPGTSPDAGAAYVFQRIGTTWTQQAKLTADDAAAGDLFGLEYVAIDGDTVVVGANLDDHAGGVDSGSAYVFVRNPSDNAWSQQAKLVASDAVGGEHFGGSVDVDGDTLVVGANASMGQTGAAYVFQRTGTTWTQEAKLTASDGTFDEFFGSTVSIHGETVAVGAGGDDGFTGAAYVFERSGSTWAETVKLTASDAAVGDQFGGAVDLDGDRLVVVACCDDDAGTDVGSAYIFERTGSNWFEQAKLNGTPGSAGFGAGAAVIDGATIVFAADADDIAGELAGSATVFVRTTPDTTPPETTITSTPPNPSNSDSAAFEFESTETDSTFECNLDDAGFEACTSPQTYNQLADGSHAFQVRATDPAGNTDPTPDSFTWTVDTTLEINIDIKPGRNTNPVNLNSNGVVPVAILTTSIADGDAVDFDATTVDTSTIEFGDTRDGFPRVTPVHTAIEDVDGDGDLDLIVHFSMRDITKVGALDADSVDAILSADTLDGIEVFGIDSVRIVPK